MSSRSAFGTVISNWRWSEENMGHHAPRMALYGGAGRVGDAHPVKLWKALQPLRRQRDVHRSSLNLPVDRNLIGHLQRVVALPAGIVGEVIVDRVEGFAIRTAS